MTTVVDEARLERMEKKLDTLSDAVVSLARMEERMITLFKRMDKYDDAQNKISERVDKVEKATVQRGVVFYLLDKLFWVIIGAAAAYIVKFGG